MLYTNINMERKRPSTRPSKHWCVTYWLQDEQEWLEKRLFLQSAVNDESIPHYIVFQKEIAAISETYAGRSHIQLYCECKRNVRFKQLQRILNLPGAHCEIREGPREKARAYCRKEDTQADGPYEVGQWKHIGQGRRSDVTGLKNLIRDGCSLREVAEQYTGLFLRYGRGIDRLRSLFAKRRTEPVRGFAYIGKSGSGKSRLAWEEHPEAYPWDGTQWWDNCDDEKVVIADDPNFSKMELNWLLKVVDRYPVQLQIKGGYIVPRFKKLIITTNIPIDEWFPLANVEEVCALKRRFIVTEI